MKEKLLRLCKIYLCLAVVTLAVGLWIKDITAIETDSVDNVTIKYVKDWSTYDSNYLGGYTRGITTRDPAVMEEWIELLEEMDQRKLREKGPLLDPPAFPCYIVEFKEGRTIKAHMSLGMARAVISKRPLPDRTIRYEPGQSYYLRAEEMMEDLEALVQ